VLSAPQLYQSGRLTVKLAKRWARLVELPEDFLLDGGKVVKPPQNRLLQMPRGHLKSTLTIGYILWRIYRNPNIRILNACNVKELAEAFIRELRGYFEDEDLADMVWNTRPHVRGSLVPPLDKSNRRYYGDDNESSDRKIVWSNTQIQVLRDSKAKEPTVMSTSVKSKSTGQHYDIVIMDDVVDMDNASTPVKINRVKRWVGDAASVRTKIAYESICGILPDGTVFSEMLGDEYVVTGTHYDPEDYYSFIKQNTARLGFAVLNRNIYKNNTDPSEGYLWSKFTRQMEIELRAELSDLPGVFEAQYLNMVNNKALQILNMDFVEWTSGAAMLENCSDGQVSYRSQKDQSVDYFEPVMAIDFAVSLSSRADYTAICVGGKSYQRRLCVADFSVGHYSTEQTLNEIVRLAKKWRIKRLYAETIGFQALYRDMIVRKLREEGLSVGVIDYKPTGNKHKRIEAQLSPYFSSGDIVFPMELRGKAAVYNSFAFFGRASTKDDPPDALAVVAEHSFSPASKDVTMKKRYLTDGDAPSTGFNMLYGGIY
jgi:predicted phage terminase large subunit-like protein